MMMPVTLPNWPNAAPENVAAVRPHNSVRRRMSVAMLASFCWEGVCAVPVEDGLPESFEMFAHACEGQCFVAVPYGIDEPHMLLIVAPRKVTDVEQQALLLCEHVQNYLQEVRQHGIAGGGFYRCVRHGALD